MIGEPYEERLSIPLLVDFFLKGKVDDRPVRSVNLAAPGRDSEYNLNKLKILLKNKRARSPDLIVFYGGHNEFLKYTVPPVKPQNVKEHIKCWLRKHSLFYKIRYHLKHRPKYSLEIDERKFFDTPLVSESKHTEIFETYRKNVSKMLELADNSNVPMIIPNLTVNVSSWGPNRSVYTGNVKDQDLFEKLYIEGRQKENNGLYLDAIKSYIKTLKFCNTFAEVYYRLGKCYYKTGDYDKAWGAFTLAIDFDQNPIMGFNLPNLMLRELSQKYDVNFIDTAEIFRTRSPNRVTDYSLFVDYCHPNIKGYMLLSYAIAEEIKQVFPGSELTDINTVSAEKVREKFGINKAVIYNICINRGKSATRHATLRFDYAERLSRAESYFSQALKLESDRYEAYLGFAMTNYLRKNVPAAERYLTKAKELNREAVDEYLSNYWVNCILERTYTPSNQV